jgi:hypothetical protein
MRTRLDALAARRRALVKQSDTLRLRLAEATPGLKQILGVADLGVAAGRYVTQRPLLLALGMAALLIVKPRAALRFVSIALTAISLFGRLRRRPSVKY